MFNSAFSWSTFFLLLFSSVELSISAWITAKYNANLELSTSSVRARIRYLLFVSTWTFVIGSVYCVAAPTSGIVSSVGFHLFFLCVTWILWLAAAAAITQKMAGVLYNCIHPVVPLQCTPVNVNDCIEPPPSSPHVPYCGELFAQEVFLWLIFVIVTFMLLFVLIRLIRSTKQADGFAEGVFKA